MIKTVIFSKDNGTLAIQDGNVYLFDNGMVASTEKHRYGCYILPQSILYPTDEELAEENCNKSSCFSDESYIEGFIAGRKSFGDKEFHLTRKELKTLLTAAAVWVASFDDIISTIIHPTFPHTITVEYDGENYLWETLKAEY